MVLRSGRDRCTPPPVRSQLATRSCSLDRRLESLDVSHLGRGLYAAARQMTNISMWCTKFVIAYYWPTIRDGGIQSGVPRQYQIPESSGASVSAKNRLHREPLSNVPVVVFPVQARAQKPNICRVIYRSLCDRGSPCTEWTFVRRGPRAQNMRAFA